MHRAFPCIAVLSVALITGCGSAGSDGTPPVTAASADTAAADQPLAEDVTAENQIADCMKKEGFQYLPHPQVYSSGETFDFAGSASLVKPDDVVRKWRQKYGFGVAAQVVYPNDPQVKVREFAKNPNQAIVDALDPAQRKAYYLALQGGEPPKALTKKGDVLSAEQLQKARNSCQGKADAVREAAFKAKQAPSKAADHQLWVRYQNDTALQAAAQKYANCLKGRGYPPEGDDPLYFQSAMPQVDEKTGPAEAQQVLAKEIKAALADVDCRGPFAQIMRTKYVKIALGQVSEGGVG